MKKLELIHIPEEQCLSGGHSLFHSDISQDDQIFSVEIVMPVVDGDGFVERVPQYDGIILKGDLVLVVTDGSGSKKREHYYSPISGIVNMACIKFGERMDSGKRVMKVSYGPVGVMLNQIEDEKTIAKEYLISRYGHMTEHEIMRADVTPFKKAIILQQVFGYDKGKAAKMIFLTDNDFQEGRGTC
jgi:hypothetical protein